KVVCPIGKAVQMDIEILKEAAGVVLTLDGHSEAAAYARIDAVGGDEIPAADKLFLVAAIGMSEPGRDAVRLQRQVLKRRVVFDGLAKPGARVIAHERFGLALVVRQDAVVSRINRGVIETRTDFRSLAVTEEVHHVAFAPKIAFEDQLAQFLVHEIEQLDRARMHRDGPRLAARARRAFDTSMFDAAARPSAALSVASQLSVDAAATPPLRGGEYGSAEPKLSVTIQHKLRTRALRTFVAAAD